MTETYYVAKDWRASNDYRACVIIVFASPERLDVPNQSSVGLDWLTVRDVWERIVSLLGLAIATYRSHLDRLLA